MRHLIRKIRHNPVLWLLVLVPAVFVVQGFWPASHAVLFVLSVLAIVPLAALRCWNRRHVGAVVAGPVPRRALVCLVVGLVLFGTVMVTLVVHHEVKPGGRVLPLVRVSPGTIELFSESTLNRPEGTVAEARTPLHPPPDGRGSPSDNPRRVLDVWFVTVDRVLMKHSRPIRPPPVNASDKRMWLRQVASDEQSSRLTLQPPFFAVMLVLAVGLLAKGRDVIPALGGRAGFRVEPKPTEGRQEP